MKNKVAPPSGAEITRRLQVVSELRSLCLSLGKAKRINLSLSQKETHPLETLAK